MWPATIKYSTKGYKSVELSAEPVYQLLESSSVFPSRLAFPDERRVSGEYHAFLYAAVHLRRYFRVFKL